jgi:hypothetical protein
MIILINAGEKVLTNPNMEEIAAQASAKVWYQIAMSPLTELQIEELEQEIARTIAEIQAGAVTRNEP